MIVVDSNVVAWLSLPGEHTKHAEQLLARGADWAVPLLWRSEFRNILAGCLRRKLLTSSASLDLQAEPESLLRAPEHDVDSRLVLELVRDSSCSAYDREYVALARTLGAKLVTMDATPRRAFPARTTPSRPPHEARGALAPLSHSLT